MQAWAERAVVSSHVDAVTCGSQTSLGKNAGCALVSPDFRSCIGYVCSYLITEQIFIGGLLHNFLLRSVIFCLPQGTSSTQCQQDWTGQRFELVREQCSSCEMLCLETTP